MIATMRCVLLYFLALVISYLTLTETVQGNSYPQLRMREISRSRIKGEYSNVYGGISFESIATNTHHSLSIKTLEGKKVLATLQHMPNTQMKISLFDKNFILARHPRNLDSHTEYLVPKRFHRFIDMAVKQAKIMRILENVLDKESVNATRETTIAELLVSTEASLVINTAMALGNRGVIGVDNPPAMTFYVLAMQLHALQNILSQKLENELKLQHTSRNQQNMLQEINRKESRNQLETMAQVNKKSCKRDNCKRCPEGNKCTGLCGFQCNCWKWVCGNCCYNKMCYDHDRCCEKNWLSWGCIGIPFEVQFRFRQNCNRKYSC